MERTLLVDDVQFRMSEPLFKCLSGYRLPWVTTTYLFYHWLHSYPSQCYALEPLHLPHTPKSDAYVLFHLWPPPHCTPPLLQLCLSNMICSVLLHCTESGASKLLWHVEPVYQFFPEYGNVHCRTSYCYTGAGWSTVGLSVCLSLSLVMWQDNEH